MEITIVKNDAGNEMTVKLKGKLDTQTAPEAQTKIDEQLGGVSKLILDLRELSYISSAGIRVLLLLSRAMSSKGDLILRSVQPSVMDVLELVGINDDLNIE